MNDQVVEFIKVRQSKDICTDAYAELENAFVAEMLKDCQAYTLDSLNQVMKEIYYLLSLYDVVMPFKKNGNHYQLYKGKVYRVDKETYQCTRDKIKTKQLKWREAQCKLSD